MDGQDLVERQEPRLFHSASLRNTPPYLSCARAIVFLKRSSTRPGRTGETTITSPSVESSSGVSAPIPTWSSSSLSRTRARLLPVLVSFLRIGKLRSYENATWYERKGQA